LNWRARARRRNRGKDPQGAIAKRVALNQNKRGGLRFANPPYGLCVADNFK